MRKVQMDGNHAPSPAHSTDKHCYQGRYGVRPTHTTHLAFDNSAEGADRSLYHSGNEMGYTQINSREPTPMERGVAVKQNAKGAFDNRK